MALSFMIVDDFLPDPMKIRNALLKAHYPDHEKPVNYPGRNADRQYLIDFVDREIMGLTGEYLVPAPGSSHAKPRIAFKGEKGFGAVHVDTCDWSGILYLSLNEHVQGGTDFYRHKATNMDHVPIGEEGRKKFGYNSSQEMLDDIIETQGTKPECWEHTMTIPMRFNRLVLFKPWYYHDAGPGFGDCNENARLIYPIFYRSKGIMPGR